MLRVADESEARSAVLRRAAHGGDMRRLRRGVYVGADHWAEAGADRQHVLEVRAVVAMTRTPMLISHRSAAAVWGLPVVGVPDTAVHATVPGLSGPDSRLTFIRHASAAPVSADEVDGIPVTTVARTVVDLARVHGFLAAVAAGDAALHRGIVTHDELAMELDRAGKSRGVRTARDAVSFVDGRSESPGESLSRVRMHELGLVAPDLQYVVCDRHGFVGRVDFWWEAVRVVGEFDGRSKYGIDEATRTAADQVWDEKLREDRLRATGLTVVRWTWADAWAGVPMAARLRAARVRG